MRTDGNVGGAKTYQPNSEGLWDDQSAFAEPPLPIDAPADHFDHYADDDHYKQPGSLFRLMSPAQQKLLFENAARSLGDAAPHIKQRHTDYCTKADLAYGAGVAAALNAEH